MIPFSQIIQNVRIQHEAESTIRWSDADIAATINRGLDDFSEVTRFYERHVTVPVVGKRTYYDLRGFFPESALGVTSVWNSLRADWLWPIAPRQLRTRWEQSAGSPQSFFMRGPFWMGIWPKPETSTGFMRVYFAGHAPHFTHPQAVLMDFLDRWVPSLEEYSMYEMAVQDGESIRALRHWGEYMARTKDAADFVRKRISKPRVLMMGAG